MTDKHSAQTSLIDPLNAPDPSDETGLNAHFGSTFAGTSSSAVSKDGSSVQVLDQHTGTSTNPFRRTSRSSKDGPVVHVRQTSRDYPSPPTSAIPRQDQFPSYRDEAFGGAPPRRTSVQHVRFEASEPTRRRRGSSLTERYPGDMSHKPLAMIKQENKAANRAPHLRKQHIPGADTIDMLDRTIGAPYHHEGPFDAASLARNTSYETSPVAALKTSNQETLKATPQENIHDAVERHRPLDGTAIIPPGHSDKFGRTLNYEETDVMREEGGDYKRWPGVDYQPGDLEGEGEPAYSLEQKLRNHKIDDSGGPQGIEVSERPRKSVEQRDPIDAAGGQQKYVELEHSMHHRESTSGGGGALDGLKRRIGSLRHRKDKD